jgi:Ala-tRNA(Pro) deacylase
MSVSGTLEAYLFDRGARYTLEQHPAAMTSLDTARAARLDEALLAKSVLLADAAGPVLAVLPASRYLELRRVRQRLGRALELAQEPDIERLFPDCALGAVPAVGAAFGVPTIVDTSLEQNEEVFFEAGDHQTLVRMSGRDFLALQSGALRAEIAIDSPALAAKRAARLRLHAAALEVADAIAVPLGKGSEWREGLARALERLLQALAMHVEKTEAPGGLLDEIVEQAPRLAREVDLLREEHVALREECLRVLARVRDFEVDASIRPMGHGLLRRFDVHRHRGADLVYEAFEVDIGGG